jgi:hypothetical protein
MTACVSAAFRTGAGGAPARATAIVRRLAAVGRGVVAPARQLGCLLLWVCALALMVAAPAESCTCVWLPDNCRFARTAAGIFEATVELIELVHGSTGLPTNADAAAGDYRRVTFRDVTPIRGKASTTLVTEAQSGACGYPFRAGARYLIVADATPDGGLSVSQCGLTRLLSDADLGLLEYVRSLDGSVAQTRVWGQVLMPARQVEGARALVPISESRVTLTGPEQRSMMTGVDGRYGFTDLPEGEYTISVDTPATIPQLGAIKRFVFALGSAESRACAEISFIGPMNSTISGQVLDDAGTPVRGVFVEFLPVDPVDPNRGATGGGSETDGDGRYHFEGLPAGGYLIGVNIGDRGPTPGVPFAETYARTSTHGTVIPLGFGGTVMLEPITTRRLAPVVVSGTIRTATGTPARGVTVSGVMYGDFGRVYPVPPVNADRAGRFELRLWQGRRYRIRVGPSSNPDTELEFVASREPLSITLHRRD